MNLYIDIGNSHIRLLAGDDLTGRRVSFACRPGMLSGFMQDWAAGAARPARVLVANVAGEAIATELTETCRAIWGLQPEYLRAVRQCCGVTNAYERPEQLGIDRWLALIAAWNRFRERLCVFDCGSAVTADVIGAEGVHEGGYIIPGQHMMQQALVEKTGQIRLANDYRFTGRPGRSTDECVYNGTLIATAGFIEYTMRHLNGNGGEPCRCVITGGGAGDVAGLLAIRCEHQPDLVLEGLILMTGN